MQLTGAEVMVKCLEEEGVSTIFGYPGGAILPFYNALRDVKNIKHVLTAHEQGAAHAADGYARASGKVGVCCATSGPGATNLVTGLANAFLDSIPVVAITGQVKSSMIGHDAFQEVDITGITMPITKQNFLVNKPEELAQTMRLAFQMAKSGRPGPVLVDVAHDVQTSMMEYHASKLRELPVAIPQKELVAAAVAALNKAERPVMLVGGGVAISGAEYEAVHLCEKMHLPVASTLMGLGCISSYREQFLGMSGLHGHERANRAIANADVVLAVGTRFNDRVTGDRNRYVGQKTIIQLDIDPTEIDKNIATSLSVMGDVKQTLQSLLPLVQKAAHADWWQQIKAWDATEDRSLLAGDRLTAPWMMKELSRSFEGENPIYVTDVGQNQMWAAQHLVVDKPRHHLTSGGCGTMGFGLPGALGAAFAEPDKQVVHICGDGGFKMTGMELYTAAREGKKLISIVINNSCLGMVRQWQQLFYNEHYSNTLLTEFDFIGFAHSCGAGGRRAATCKEFQEALKAAREADKPFLIEVIVEQGDLVEPMVAAGAAVDDFVKINRCR